MKTKWCVLVFLIVATLAQAQTNNLTALLQQGLLEEQANRDLDAAIADYKALAMQFDKDRQLAATAIFRLGECYRAQGKTNEAAAQYQKILRDFSDQQTLATLSRQDLAGMGISDATTPGRNTVSQQQKDLLAKQIALAEQDLADTQKLVQVGQATPADARVSESKLLRLRQELDALTEKKSDSLNLSISPGSEEDQEIVRIRQMIQNSPDLINAQQDGNTPLTLAAWKGQIKVVNFLLDHGADINQAAKGMQPIHRAVVAGNRAMVELLLNHGANVNARTDDLMETPLILAAVRGFQAVTETLIEHHADVNMAEKGGMTPLHIAAMHGRIKLLQTLLAAGASVNVETDNGRTPLSYVPTTEMVKVLLAAKADPNGGKLDAPLLCAIHKQDAAAAELLLQAGANPNAAGNVDWDVIKNGSTHWAAGHPSETPLFLAVSLKQLPLVQLLLKFKADPNDLQTDGQSLLFQVLDKPEIVQALLDAGADVNATMIANGGFGPHASFHINLLQTAINWNAAETVKLLLQHGTNPNVRNERGNSALHYAAYNLADESVFTLLFDYKADPNVRNEDGKTPLDILKQHLQNNGSDDFAAKKAQAEKLIALLRQHGALDNLPDWNRIIVGRSNSSLQPMVAVKDTNNWNRFTLFEFAFSWCRFNKTSFPDFSRVSITRPGLDGKSKQIDVNLLNSTNGIDEAKDMPLAFGDVVEIPERPHTLAEKDELIGIWERQLKEHLERTDGSAKLIVDGGKTITIPLKDYVYDNRIGTVLGSQAVRNVLTSFSDLTQVKIRRTDSKTGAKSEWTLDCSEAIKSHNPNNAPDLRLRTGDVIEVPVKP